MNKVLLLVVLLLFVGCSHDNIYEYESKISKNTLSLIKELKPELLQKIRNIEDELNESKKKIEELNNLKKAYPQQEKIIIKALNQWNQLERALEDIYEDFFPKLENIYVVHEINKISGNQSIDEQAKEILKEANEALKNAQYTKEVIERSLYNE